MPERRESDLINLIEIITAAIEIHGSEEDFFLRSSRSSTNEAAKLLFNEIAEDMGEYRHKLEEKRRALRDELAALHKSN